MAPPCWSCGQAVAPQMNSDAELQLRLPAAATAKKRLQCRHWLEVPRHGHPHIAEPVVHDLRLPVANWMRAKYQ